MEAWIVFEGAAGGAPHVRGGEEAPFPLVVAFGDAAFASAFGKLFVDNDVNLEMEVHTQRNRG